MLNLPLLHARKVSTFANDSDLANYLLEAIPLLNTYHILTADPKLDRFHFQNQLRLFCEKFFPRLKVKTFSDKQSLESQLTSKCCKARLQQTYELSLVCTSCGRVSSNSSISLSNPLRNVSYNRNLLPSKVFSYKRLNHLREFLRSLQGFNQAVPESVFERVKKYFQRSSLNSCEINATRVRNCLKKLKFNKYYETSHYIAKELNPSFKLFTIDPYYEELLISQFVRLEKPFERIRSKHFPKRKNFLSYSHVVLHLNILNNRRDLNENVFILKSSKLAHFQEKLIKLIFNELGWKFEYAIIN